jgi:dephospho-CoA kinase
VLNVGLTGGIGSGKSTIAAMFLSKGAYLIDFDVLAHEVQNPGQPAWKAIIDSFGKEVLDKDGRIDRVRLADIVFEDKKKLAALNGIVHPAVFDAWSRRLCEIQSEKTDAIVLSDVPLLIEAGVKHLFDLIILIYISPEEQLQRIMERNGYSLEEAKKRLSSQMPINEKLGHADIVINNQSSRESAVKKVDEVWKELVKREMKKHL